MDPSVFISESNQLPGRNLRPEYRDDGENSQGFPVPTDASYWDVFIPDDDEVDPLPEPGDFWIEPDE